MSLAGVSNHIASLVDSFGEENEAGFYTVALQIAARESRQGHHALAANIIKAVENAKQKKSENNVVNLAQPRGELGDLLTVSYPNKGINQLILSEITRSKIVAILEEQMQRELLWEYGFKPAQKILLEGPPGTGKSMTAEVLASELSLPLYKVHLDSLFSKYLGETSSKLKNIFEKIDSNRGIFLFDEFDALSTDRDNNDIGEARRILNSLLIFLDDFNSDSLIIATTNNSQIIDRAIFRRFDEIIHYDLPGLKEATLITKKRLGSLAYGLDFNSIADSFEGLSQAEILKGAETTAKRALLSGRKRITAKGLSENLNGVKK